MMFGDCFNFSHSRRYIKLLTTKTHITFHSMFEMKTRESLSIAVAFSSFFFLVAFSSICLFVVAPDHLPSWSRFHLCRYCLKSNMSSIDTQTVHRPETYSNLPSPDRTPQSLPPLSGPLTVIVLGASGDLAKKKTFPALFGLLKVPFFALECHDKSFMSHQGMVLDSTNCYRHKRALSAMRVPKWRRRTLPVTL